jgi:hypothetical protein
VGRTNPTFRDRISAVEQRWQPFRRALRRRDRPAFDRLFRAARDHADAGGQRNHPEPLFPILVAALVEQERRIARLEATLVEERLDDRPRPDPTADADLRDWCETDEPGREA